MKTRPEIKLLILIGTPALTLVLGLGLWAAAGETPAALPQAPSAAVSPKAAPIQALAGPWVVAVQPGHWKVEELPYELRRLRVNTGAEDGGVREMDLNLAVTEALLRRIERKGWKALLVPATVPPDLRADAFLSIHADWSGDPGYRGWKLAPSWRASGASRDLAAALSAALSAAPGLVPSPDGPTVDMRGYFAFNARRFEHASSPFTPAVLLELGFVTSAEDRARLKERPDFYAEALLAGLERYFAGRNRDRTDDLRPLDLPWVAAGPEGTVVRTAPTETAPQLWKLEAGSVLLPVDVRGDWYEVFVRRFYATGWIKITDTVNAEDPRWPMPGENRPSGAPLPAAENAKQ